MQTYVEYNSLRAIILSLGLFVLGYMIPVVLYAESNEGEEKEVARDTLYQKWSQSKSTLPFLFYDLKNFDSYYQRIEAESLVKTYGIGGVYLSGGDLDEVQPWLQSVFNASQVNPMIIAKISHVFELPFDLGIDQPNHFEIECLSDLYLVQELADYHVRIFNSLGITAIHIDHLPSHYLDEEKEKVRVYMDEILRSGIKVSIGRQSNIDLKEFGWQNVLFLDRSLAKASGYNTTKKARKKFRKETGYDGFVTAVLDNESFYDEKDNQLVNNTDLLILPDNLDPQFVINNILTSGVLKRSEIKNATKTYFDRWQKYSIHRKIDSLGLNDPGALIALNKRIEQASITLISDELNQVPMVDLSNKELYSFSDVGAQTSFAHLIDLYKKSNHFTLGKLLEDSTNLPQEATLLVDLSSVQDIGSLKAFVQKLAKLKDKHQMIIFYQGNKFGLKYLADLSSVLWSPEISEDIKRLMVQSVFGAFPILGSTPSYLVEMGVSSGVSRAAIGRVSYAKVDFSGLNYNKLIAIDSVVTSAIADQVFPGCQLLMIKGGEVVLNKSYGYLTYDSISHVQWDNLYDIASVTKTTATVPMIMSEIQNGHISLSGHVGDYLYEYQTSDKADLQMTDLLTHRSGLKSYIPFWSHAAFEGDSATFLYKKQKSSRRRSYDYVKVNWSDSINHWIADSKYNSLKQPDNTYKYLYSDLGFMIMKELVEEQSQMSLDELADSLLFKPLAMDYTTYNPLMKYDSSVIVPTAKEEGFRDVVLRGQVHDRNAAILGGVSGHAGLFSNANDLGKYMQMMLQNGYYGGKQYYDSTLVHTFTSKLSEDANRALGWDKPRRYAGNASKYASDKAFGHSGFTGTLVWADPEYDLVYIFLSNRIYPDPQNYKITQQNIRTKIHDLMYESFLSLESDNK